MSLFLEILDLEGLCDTFPAYRDPVVGAEDVISPVQHLLGEETGLAFMSSDRYRDMRITIIPSVNGL